jgi:uncharacterized protein
MSIRPTILVFLKYPKAGQVKTRLAKDIGAVEAMRVYENLVAHQLAQIPTSWNVEIYYHGTEDEKEMLNWLGSGYNYFPQVDGDLGVKLESAFAESFSRGARVCIAIGGDCPYLGEEILIRAVQILEVGDMVIGPATDGGYYLIGMPRFLKGIFDNVEWSCDETLRMTIRNIENKSFKYQLINELEDVDDLESYQRAKGIIKINTP